MAKRDESIVPLSREHHYALMLCLRLRRGLHKFGKNSEWLALATSHVLRFFQVDLTPHFAAEEEVLFPSIAGSEKWNTLVQDLLAEHQKIQKMAEEVTAAAVAHLPKRLGEFAALLEGHVRKEENSLFPLYESKADRRIIGKVGRGIRDRVGDAMKPRSSEIILEAWDLR